MVDPYVASQIAAKAVPSVVKAKLLQVRSEFPVGLVIAIEGDDDKSVYSRWIAKLRPKLHYEFLVCGDKRQVKNLSNTLYRDVANLKKDVLCFVDRDFDDLDGFLDTRGVHMLERYSVENFLVERDVLDASLAVAFPCNGMPLLRSKICEIFEVDYEDFLNYTKELNKRIFVARRLKIDIEGLVPKSIDKYVSIEIGKISCVEHDIDKLIPFSRNPTVDEVAQLDADFERIDRRDRYRGKFAHKFLMKWLDKLVDEFKNPKLGLFGLLGSDGKVDNRELNLGSFALRSPVPVGLDAILP